MIKYLRFLPPTNKVWDKVMFLHLRVVLWGVGFPACITGHMTRGICIQGGLPRGRGEGSASASRGSASKGDLEDLPGSASRGGLHPGGLGRSLIPRDTWDTMEYGQQAGSMHPTGMLSCSFLKIPVIF